MTHGPAMTFAPGSHLGILGGGQLARMTALAARRMGYRISVFDPAGPVTAPPRPCATAWWVRRSTTRPPWKSLRARGGRGRLRVREHPGRRAANRRAVLPGAAPLERPGNLPAPRARESCFLHRHGFPHTEFRVVTSAAELAAAVHSPGNTVRAQDGRERLRRQGPGKNPAHGMDPARGLAGMVRCRQELPRGVLEAWVEFAAELSVDLRAQRARPTSCPSPCSRTSTPTTFST